MNVTSQPPHAHQDVIGQFRVRLNRALRDFQDRCTPVATLTYAQSVDGCIAAADGRTLQLSNPESQKLTHRLRGMHDAILVGINTVLSDDPQLNVRLVRGKNPQPIVVDSRLRLPLEANLLRSPDVVRPIIATGERASRSKERELTDRGAQVLRLPLQEDGLLNLVQVLSRLKEMGLETVMIEGGARIIASVVALGLADQLVLTIAPVLVGGLRSIAPLSGRSGVQMPYLEDLHYQSLAGDLVIRGDLRYPSGTPGHERANRASAAEHPAALLGSAPRPSRGGK